MINFLKLVSKVTLSNEEQKAFSLYMEQHDVSYDTFKILYKNKIHFLFLKHLVEQNQIEFISNKLGYDISALLYFNNRLYKEYMEVLEYLTSEFEYYGIKYCILKGFSLIESLYRFNDCIYRKFSDLDILVDKSDVKNANVILNKCGFIQGHINQSGEIVKAPRKEIIYWSLNSHQEHGYVKFSKDAITPFMKLNVDINTTIFDGGSHLSPIATPELLNHRKLTSTSSGKTFFTLDFTYELIQLCYHFYKDTLVDAKRIEANDYNLSKFCDIREYILKFYNQINWNVFNCILNTHGLSDPIGQVLYIISAFYEDIKIDSILNGLDTRNPLPDYKSIFEIMSSPS